MVAVLADNMAAPCIYDRIVLGGFLEHLDNPVYGGVFEPGSLRRQPVAPLLRADRCFEAGDRLADEREPPRD